MEKFKKICLKSIDILAAAVFALIFLLVFFTPGKIIFACKRLLPMKNTALLLIFLIFMIVIKLAFENKHLKKINFDKIAGFIFIFSFFLSLYISYNIFFETGWDSGSAIIPAARFLAAGDKSILLADYFSHYPNNSLLILIYSYILKFNGNFGIFNADMQLMSIVFINVLISSLACLMTYKISKKLFDNRAAFFIYLQTIFLVNFSGWNVICYSDSFSLIFPVLIAYIYICSSFKPLAKYMLICITGCFGYMIKPQNIIIVIAIIIISAICSVKKKNIYKIIKISVPCAAASAAVFITMALVFAHAGFQNDKNKKIGMTHFYMMGLNQSTMGGYNSEDAEASFACKNQNERKQFNIKTSKERLKNMGGAGYAKLVFKKTLTNYSDGLFAWGMEGQFFMKTTENKNLIAAPYLKNVYYTNGSLFNRYALFEQFIWTGIIALIFLFLLLRLKKREENRYISVLILAVLGLTLFQILFEARARYLYSYVPIYAILACGAVKAVLDGKFKRRIKK